MISTINEYIHIHANNLISLLLIGKKLSIDQMLFLTAYYRTVQKEMDWIDTQLKDLLENGYDEYKQRSEE